MAVALVQEQATALSRTPGRRLAHSRFHLSLTSPKSFIRDVLRPPGLAGGGCERRTAVQTHARKSKIAANIAAAAISPETSSAAHFISPDVVVGIVMAMTVYHIAFFAAVSERVRALTYQEKR